MAKRKQAGGAVVGVGQPAGQGARAVLEAPVWPGHPGGVSPTPAVSGGAGGKGAPAFGQGRRSAPLARRPQGLAAVCLAVLVFCRRAVEGRVMKLRERREGLTIWRGRNAEGRRVYAVTVDRDGMPAKPLPGVGIVYSLKVAREELRSRAVSEARRARPAPPSEVLEVVQAWRCRCIRCGHVWVAHGEPPQNCARCSASSWWVKRRPGRPPQDAQ